MAEGNGQNGSRLWQWVKGSSLPGWVAAAFMVFGSGLIPDWASTEQVKENTTSIETLQKEKADADRVWGKFGAMEKKLNDFSEARQGDSQAIQEIKQDISSIKATLQAMQDRQDRIDNVGAGIAPRVMEDNNG